MKVKFEFHHLRHKRWLHGNFYPIPTIRLSWDSEEIKSAFTLLWLFWRFDLWFYDK